MAVAIRESKNSIVLDRGSTCIPPDTTGELAPLLRSCVIDQQCARCRSPNVPKFPPMMSESPTATTAFGKTPLKPSTMKFELGMLPTSCSQIVPSDADGTNRVHMGECTDSVERCPDTARLVELAADQSLDRPAVRIARVSAIAWFGHHSVLNSLRGFLQCYRMRRKHRVDPHPGRSWRYV